MNSLPDINIWLALSFSAHPHHASAMQWFASRPTDSAAFCRMTQQGYLRLSTNPKVFGSDALSLPRAWKTFDSLLADERVRFVEEPEEVEGAWRVFTSGESFSAKIWNDAYLAAFAKQGGFQLTTFGRGFSRYAGVPLEILR